MNKNEAFTHLAVQLPPDIARRKEMGDLEGALRLIDRRLATETQPEMRGRLLAEQVRLARLPDDYSLTREQALALIRTEWTDCTEEQFDQLVDAKRIDWRMKDQKIHYHDRFLESLRFYPKEATGVIPPSEETTAYRDATLARMEAEGGLTARITIKATIRANVDTEGKEVQAWIPLPAACPQQSEIRILDATPGYECAPEDAPQRTIWWKAQGQKEFTVTYSYLHHAPYVDPLTIQADPVQPTFDLEEQLPHIIFTPYLRSLAARITEGLTDPIQKAKAIYDYVTGQVDYRFQPAYILLEPIADQCARDLRGDCGMFALLFITLCRLSGIPAQWQSGLSVEPTSVGSHDWAMFYVAPHGWLWADCSFGSSSRRRGEPERRRHYFGNLDPWRMVANSRFQAPLTPPMTGWRHDPYDNQQGEMMVDGEGLYNDQRTTDQELLEFQLL